MRSEYFANQALQNSAITAEERAKIEKVFSRPSVTRVYKKKGFIRRIFGM